MIDTKGLIPLAIGCTGGSGSRVLRDILDTSPQVYMDPDFDPKTKDSMGSRSFIHSKDRSPETLRRLIEEFMEGIVASIPPDRLPELRYFGWKNPGNIDFTDLFFQIHPGFRFFHLLRDPAAIATGRRQSKAYRKRQEKGRIPPGVTRKRDTLQRWEAANLPVWKRYRDDPHYLVVRYEDMITKAEQSVRSIFAWLGIEEFNMEAAVAAIAPPPNPISRGDGVDVSIIGEACELLGYGHRVLKPAADSTAH